MRRGRPAWSFAWLVAAFGTAAGGAMTSAEAIAQLLNSRNAGSAAAFETASRKVAEDARNGAPVQRYVLALLGREENVPEPARLSDETRRAWLEEGRTRFKALSARTDNALVWYLLALDEGDTNLLCKAAEKGNVQAINAWGNLRLEEGVHAGDTNTSARCLAEARDLFRRAAGKGDANGLYNLGMCYARGLTGTPDFQSAFLCFRAAAEKGHPGAMNSFGWFLREGRVGKPDLPFAVEWFRKAADYGDATGCFNLALAYLRGEGVAKDRARAAQLMKQAAEGGSPEAMDAWGVTLMRGADGVAEDKAAAAKWFRRSADIGYPPAMENLVQCYDNGWGVPADAAEALKWKMRSRAARGDAAAGAWLHQNKLDE